MRNSRAELLVLAMDIGSSSTRSALFDHKARQLPETGARVEYSLRYTSDGGAELAPLILQRAAERCLAETLRQHRASLSLRKIPIAAIGGSSLWHALLGLDRHLRPITPIFTWADSRATNDAARLREKLSEREIHARTGCMLRATFWPAKLLWLRRTQATLFRRVSMWASPVDWIFRELFGAIGSSASMASATGLYNLKIRDWDNPLCQICHVDPKQLPPIANVVTPTRSHSHALTPARLFAAIGDGAAGNLGSGADRQGIVAINMGTSAAVRMMQTNHQAAQTRVPFGLFRYVVDAQRSVIGGAVSNAGNLRIWCLRDLRLKETEADRALLRSKAAIDPLTVLPFWVSERAPTWPEQQLGVIDGLNQSTRATDILRATTTAVFYRLAQIFDLVEGATVRGRRIIVSGGILHSIAAIKLLADAIGRDVEIAREAEASLRGAAVHALKQMGIEVKIESAGRTVRCLRALAAKHRERRQRQIDLEKVLTSQT